MKPKTKRIALAASGTLLVVCASAWLAVYLDARKQPVYEGRRVGAWFHDLCLWGNSSTNVVNRERLEIAKQAFRGMDSNAVPFPFTDAFDTGHPTHLVRNGDEED